MLLSIDYKNNIFIKYNPRIITFEKDNFEFESEGFRALSEGYYISETPTFDFFNLDYKAFTDKFKGAYIFVLHNKKTNNINIYNDLLSKAYVYYYNSENMFACASSYFELVKYLKEKDIKLDYDFEAQEYFKNNGVFCGDKTYFNEIKFLKAFEYIEITDKAVIKKIPYPKPINVDEISFDAAVDKAYYLFEQASSAAINKNIINKKAHVCSLSGGMDSRAIFLQLVKKGVKPIYTYTYAQKGSKDETISEKIAKDFGTEHVFYDISGGEFVKKRDQIIKLNEGQMSFSGATGAHDTIRLVKAQNIGLVYLGIGGGEIMGDILNEEGESPTGDIPKLNYIKNFDDIRACMNSALCMGDMAESYSPFLYEDLFIFLMQLPLSYKQKRRLYVSIFKRYMPNKYSTTMFRGKIGNKIAKPLRVLSYIIYSLFKKNKYNMNPFELWWENNPNFKNFIIDSFNDDMKNISGLDVVKLQNEFNNANIYKKTNIISLSGVLSRL